MTHRTAFPPGVWPDREPAPANDNPETVMDAFRDLAEAIAVFLADDDAKKEAEHG